MREQVASYAESLIGKPASSYRGPTEGCDETGFDCSGLCKYIFDKIGIPVPTHVRHSNEFFDSFGVFIHAEAVDRGDLVFFSKNSTSPTHIGIMISQEAYIHSPGRTGTNVCVTDLYRVPISTEHPDKIYFFNPIGFKRVSIKDGRYQRFNF